MEILSKDKLTIAARYLYEHIRGKFPMSPMHDVAWEDAGVNTKEAYLDWCRIAAPHLQIPWEKPTIRETLALLVQANDATPSLYVRDCHEAICTFVAKRNAEIDPSSQDSRLEIVSGVVRQWANPDVATLIANKVIEALDKTKA